VVTRLKHVTTPLRAEGASLGGWRELESELLVKIAAAATFCIGLVVFIGWAADVEPMRRFFLGSLQMLPNTSVGFMVAGVALWILRAPGSATERMRLVARALASFVFALGVLTFGERMYGWDVGIDQLLFADLVREHPYRPFGRMATNSTVAFTFGGAALFLLDSTTSGIRRVSEWFATTGLAISSLALIGHLYDAESLYQIDRAAGMAIATALAFFTLHSGILVARPNATWIGPLLARGGGVLARRLLVAVTIVPPVLGWMFIYSREQGIVSREVGVAILVVAVIGIQLTLLLRAVRVVQAGQRAQALALQQEAAARGEAERANRAKNDFLAVMSHELRTPLNAIIGYGSLLRDGIPDPATAAQRHQLERIGASAKHLLALIDEVLTLSRLELNEERVTPVHISIATLVEDAAAMVEPQARAKGLPLLLHLSEPELMVHTDAGKLRQALVNLMGNAVKFTDRGEITVRVAADANADEVTIEVEDTGLGIAPEHLQRVFEAFWQVDQAATRRAGGTGLGLNVTRRLVRLLGGDVTVRSTLGQGSCFTLRLPCSWRGATPADGTRPLVPSSDSKRNVATPARAVVSSGAGDAPRT
jgi:signal transduction histidine kinase